MLKKKSTIALSKKRVRVIEKALLVVDPSKKTLLEKMKKGEEIDASTLFPLAQKAIEKNESAILEASKEAKEYLLSLRKSDIFTLEGRFFFLKKELRTIKEKVTRIENHLDEKKDDFVFTFLITLEYDLQQYKEALKREKREAKRQAKKEKRKEARREDTLKERAWESEIDVSSKAIVLRTAKYVDSFIEHLSTHYLVKEVNVMEKANLLLALWQRSITDSHMKIDKNELKQKAIELLGEVGIKDPEKRIHQYPFEFSGGMRQRIVIAIALSSDPEILICDEPTTALDVTIQAQILDLINSLKEKRHLSVIFITHNLGVVANMADDIAIMYAGKIVEYGTADDIFYHPAHPYTWALLSSMPDLDTKERLDSIPGTPPNMIIPPKGDAFAARNKYAMQIDFEEEPPFFTISPTHKAATWLLDKRAPHVKPPKSVTDRIARFAKLNRELETKEKEAKS